MRKHLAKKHAINCEAVNKSKQTEVNVPVTATAPASTTVPSATSTTTTTTTSTTTSTASSSQPSMHKFVIRKTMAELVAKLIALDGIPAFAISKSDFIRESFVARNMQLPAYPNKIMDLLHQFFEFARNEKIEEIRALKQKGVRFSGTTDEWTSAANKRYSNANIHASDGIAINLGLIRIPKHGTAEILKALWVEKLAEFNLCEDDMVAATTDGATVMVKMGRLIDSEHQECLNHGFHLAVIDVIFGKIQTEPLDEDEVEPDISELVDDMPDDLELEEEEIEEDEHDEQENFAAFFVEENIMIRPDIKHALDRVRKNVKTFRRSPVKNAILQEFMKAKHGHERALILDCPTRWSSQATMLERFLPDYDCIKKALTVLKCEHQLVDDIIPLLKDLLEALQPIELAVEKLSSCDCDLLKSEGKLNFLFYKII